jgi:hypothetical protein
MAEPRPSSALDELGLDYPSLTESRGFITLDANILSDEGYALQNNTAAMVRRSDAYMKAAMAEFV